LTYQEKLIQSEMPTKEDMMEFTQLGKSNIKCSKIILGAWAIGGWMWGGTDEKAAIEAIQTSLDNGINCIDTAPVYGMGLSEELVGKAIKGRRDKVVIATKCCLRWDTTEGSDPWETVDPQGKPFTVMTNGNPASIIKECEDSLRRLGVDVIDLLQIHWPDTNTSIGDSWNALVQLKKQGKVKAIGVCNYNLSQLAEANEIYPLDTLQSPYSILRTDLENEIIPFCKENQITTLAYSPLERGLLTGKATEDQI
jgi:aryl-alcohol dehydrogenase-like predicted oxidoreductase